MDSKTFNELVDYRCAEIERVLAKKADEYARGDRLSNFKKAAEIQGIRPEQACVNFMMKHIVSIMDLVHDLDDGKSPAESMLDEKIGDAINYLILLDGLFRDRSPMKTEIDKRVDELEKDGKITNYGNLGSRLW